MTPPNPPPPPPPPRTPPPPAAPAPQRPPSGPRYARRWTRIARFVAELVRDFGDAIDLTTSGRAGTVSARDSAQLPAEGRTG